MSDAFPVPSNEACRIERVKELRILESLSDPVFDRLVSFAAEHFDVPIVLISIVDEQHQWFTAKHGIELQGTARGDSFCAHAIISSEMFEVPDATRDERFRDNPLVIGEPGIRFYAGRPLVTSDGLHLGSLCLIDTQVRQPLSAHDRRMFEHFAELVMLRIDGLRALNYIDEPTGLFNRIRLENDVEQEMALGHDIVVLAADLLSPSFLNEIVKALGYPFSTELMLSIKARLQCLLPEGCDLYKISPHRFGMLLKPEHLGLLDTLLSEIVEAFQAPVDCQGIPLQAQVGIGVLELSPERDKALDWMRLVVCSADNARARGTGWAYYEPQLDQAQQRAFGLLSALSEALHHVNHQHEAQLWLEYQPRVELASGACRSVEALLRWRHPTWGQVGPGEFIPLAEKTALMRPLSLLVLQMAVEQAARWQAQALPLSISINVSAADLEGPAFIDRMLELLREHGVSSERIEIEFTESALIRSPQVVRQQLERIRALGIDVAIDDFGTGYSNWTYLRELPASLVKIDQSFMRNLHENRQRRLTQTIIEVARRLGYRVVAEGVETAELAELMHKWGCDQGQGYYFARPMPAQCIEQWLEQRAIADGSPPA